MIESVALLAPSRPELLVDGAPRGMGGGSINTLVEGFLSAGVEVDLITLMDDLSQTWTGQSGKLRVTGIPFRPRARDRGLDFFARERSGILEALGHSRAQVISAHWQYEYAMAALRDGRPTVVTVRDAPLTILKMQPNSYRAIRAAMSQYVARKARHFTAPSPYVARAFQRQMMMGRPIATVPNPVAAEESAFPRRAAPRPSVLAVADSSKWKNVATLIDSFRMVWNRIPEAELRLVGPGLDPHGPLASRRPKNVAGRIRFLGPISPLEVAKEMSTAWILVHPALEESFGNVLTEAMVARIPIVAGIASGAVPWVTGNGRAARLVDVRNPIELGEAIVDLLVDGNTRDTMVTSAAAWMRDRFTVSTVVNGYVAEFDRALAANMGDKKNAVLKRPG